MPRDQAWHRTVIGLIYWERRNAGLCPKCETPVDRYVHCPDCRRDNALLKLAWRRRQLGSTLSANAST